MSERRDRDVFMSIDSPEDWYEGTDIFDIEQTVAGVQDYIAQLEAERDKLLGALRFYAPHGEWGVALSEQEEKE